MPVWKFGYALTPTELIDGNPCPWVVFSQLNFALFVRAPPSRCHQEARNAALDCVTGAPMLFRNVGIHIGGLTGAAFCAIALAMLILTLLLLGAVLYLIAPN
jgi:hypothetical protein